MTGPQDTGLATITRARLEADPLVRFYLRLIGLVIKLTAVTIAVIAIAIRHA